MTNRTLLFARLFLIGSLAMWGCANQGSPEGGPYDTEPPRLVSASPQMKATEVKDRRFVLHFDEYIKLSSEQDKIIVSPPQLQPARITANGKSVTIHLEDTLKKDVTYGFYFGDAISDNNEDNPLEDFGYLVSTGKHIDSMQLSGQVVDALTYEPVADLLVGAHYASSLTDSTLSRELFPFVSKTNKMGHFTMRGLPDTTYQVFATKDNDRNYKYNEKSEGIAFNRTNYRTSLRDSMRTDTIRIDSIVRRDTLHRDSLVTYPHTYYFPNDIALRYSVPTQVREGVERHSRPDSLICRIEFLAEPKRIPHLRSLDRPMKADSTIYWATAKGRVVDYWLRDKELIAQDSVRFILTYPKTDSLMAVHEVTDTLTFLRPKVRTERKAKKGEVEKSPLHLAFSAAKGIQAETPKDSLVLTASRPLAPFRQEVIHLEATTDSVYKPLSFTLRQDSLDRLRYEVLFARAYGGKYRIRIDSAALQDLYGAPSDSVAFAQSVQEEKELGHLVVTLQGVKEHALVQLLDKSDAVLSAQLAHVVSSPTPQRATDSLSTASETTDPMLETLLKQQRGNAQTASKLPDTTRLAPPDTERPDTLLKVPVEQCQVSFRDLKPGDYYLRLIIDTDESGDFTPGDYPKQDPEEVYYCPATFAIKKGFTTEERWDIHAVSPFSAKPEALRKTKPEEGKKKREDKNIEYYKRWGKKKK